MDINLDNIALELYGKLQTRFPNVEIGDETGDVLEKKEDIPKARFFEFPYQRDGVTLGTITITLDEDDGLIVQIGGDLVDHKRPSVSKFIRSLGAFANKRMLHVKVINLEKSNLDKRDYQFQAKRKEPEPMLPMMESKFYGTSKISYQDLGEARIVIKHSQAVNPEVAAGRTMHIESIYVENAQGERFKYPFKHLNGARALAEHLKHGGNPYDGIGKYITGLSEEMASLRKFKGFVSRNEAIAESMGEIPSKVMERIEQVKEEVQKLQRKSYYEQFAGSFTESEAQEIPETTMEDWVDRLTIRSFNEDLKAAFPYIFKLVSESDIPVKELGPEDMLSELSKDTLQSYQDKAVKTPPSKNGNWVSRVAGVARSAERLKKDDKIDELSKDTLSSYAQRGAYDAAGHMHSSGLKAGVKIGKGDSFDIDSPDQNKAQKRLRGVSKAIYKLNKNEALEDQFESFINTISEDDGQQTGENNLFSPNVAAQNAAIQKLNQILQNELKGGPDGINAIESLHGIIDDPELLGMLKDIDPDLDSRPLIQQYVLNRDAQVAARLTFGDGQVGGEEPVAVPPAPAPAPAPAAPAPEAPPAAPPAPDAGMPPPAPAAPAPVAEGVSAKLKARFIKAKECGATLDTEMDFGHRAMTLRDAIAECGMSPEDVGFESEQSESGVHQILKSIAGFWNKEEGNFTIGGTRAKQKVVKSFKDGEFPNATSDDVKLVLQKIEQMDPSTSEKNTMARLAGVQTPALDAHDGPEDQEEFGMDNIVGSLKAQHAPQPQMNPQDLMKAIIQKINFGN